MKTLPCELARRKGPARSTEYEQETPELLAGVQGGAGARCHPWRQDAGRVGRPRPPESLIDGRTFMARSLQTGPLAGGTGGPRRASCPVVKVSFEAAWIAPAKC